MKKKEKPKKPKLLTREELGRALEWSSYSGYEGELIACPACGGIHPRSAPEILSDSGVWSVGHADDCYLKPFGDPLLIKAVDWYRRKVKKGKTPTGVVKILNIDDQEVEFRIPDCLLKKWVNAKGDCFSEELLDDCPDKLKALREKWKNFESCMPLGEKIVLAWCSKTQANNWML